MGNKKTRFSDLKLKSKLLILFGAFILSILILGALGYETSKAYKTISIIFSQERVFTQKYDAGIEYFYRHKLSGNESDLNFSLENLNNATKMASTFAIIDSIVGSQKRDEWLPYLFDIYKEGVNGDIKKVELMASQVYLISKINKNKLQEIQDLANEASVIGRRTISTINKHSNSNSSETLDLLEKNFNQFHDLTERFSSKTFTFSQYVNRLLTFVLIAAFLVMGTFLVIISISISNSITSPINKLVENFKQIALGNLSTTVRFDSKNEVGELSRAFLQIQKGIRFIIIQSKKVAAGKFQTELKPASEKDELSRAFNEMASRLRDANIKSEKEKWLQEGINKLDDEMRGNYSVRELSDQIISFLSAFLEIEMGAVFVFDEVLKHLEFTGSIGIKKEEVTETLKPGEGLIGKAAKQKSLQIIAPQEKYHKSFSATGEIVPQKIYLLPLHYNGRIQAVIELASVNELDELKKEFLELIKERVSVNLSAAVARYRGDELLKQTVEQAKILKQREKELNDELKENERIHENLSRETALLDSMLGTLPDRVYFKDSQSRFLRVSKSMLDLFGLKSAKDIIGKTDFDFHPTEKAKQFFAEEQKIIKSGNGFANKIRKDLKSNGEAQWSSVTKLPMYDNNGKCIGTFGITKDITNVKKLEIEVNERNEILELQKKELEHINSVLKQQQEEMNSAHEELKTQEEELRVANEELAEQTKILTENEKNLQVQQEELRVINEELEAKSNQLEQQKISITKQNDNLLKIQNELRQKANELEQASQYKSEFLANMSHELRTPLNSLLILSKLLSQNKKGNLIEDQVKSLKIIHKSGNDLLELINEILDLSKIEAGKMKYEFSDVPVRDISAEINQNFKPVAENKKLQLEVKKSDKFPAVLFTDRQRLMQIIKNLLANAFKFTSSGGIEVIMDIPEKETKFTKTELNHTNTCYIAVKDSGVGIPEDKLDAIFEAFQQADGSISRKFGGTGLGLSISKQLTDALGGEIKVDSTDGQGSVFTVYLPTVKELVGNDIPEKEKTNKTAETKTTHVKTNDNLLTTNTQTTKSEKTQEDKKETVLPQFIDDDRDANAAGLLVLIIHNDKLKAEKLKDLSHKRNFQVIAASSIGDGVKLAEKYAPEAIILSAELSNSDELENLKKNQYTRKLPVHFVTRIEDSVLESLEELKTPESGGFEEASGNIERKISEEYKQVLLVEDDEVTRKLISLLFENKDIKVSEAHNAQQAYDLISTKPYDCIILDIGLPDYSGEELLKKLKRDNIPTPNVIIHTARELTQKESRSLQKYSDSIVVKGLKSDERLMDEVTLFLHQVESTVPKKFDAYKDEKDSTVFKGKKVLVVDDDIRNVFAVAQILEEREIEILEAENGEVALEILKSNTDVDLVLMDIMMPVMDGYEAMKKIRETPEIKNIPIITLTAKAMKEDYQKAIDSGANDYISKPVDVEKLISLLKIWLFK